MKLNERHTSIKNIIVSIKYCLENYKIFFETTVMIFLTVMSIIISAVGVQINDKTKEIYEKQLEIIDNDREPYFTIKCEHIDGLYKKEDYVYTKDMYIITNGGGLITGAYIPEVYTHAIISVYNPKTEVPNKYFVQFMNLYEKSHGLLSAYYDDDKKFIFYKCESEKFDNLVNMLKSKLSREFPVPADKSMYTANVQLNNTVEIEYVNYKNEECFQTYKFMTGDRLILMNENIYENISFIGQIDINKKNANIVDIICDKIKSSQSE